MNEKEALQSIKTTLLEKSKSADVLIAEREFFSQNRYKAKIVALLNSEVVNYELIKELQQAYPLEDGKCPIRIEFLGTSREIARDVEFEALLFEATLLVKQGE